MTLELEVGVLLSVAAGVIGAWWAMAKMFVSQFETRQNERFDTLQRSITMQKTELDSHMTKQDAVMIEVRRIETEMMRSQADAAMRYQTKTESTGQHQQILDAIRALGNRIDQLHSHVNGNGTRQQ